MADTIRMCEVSYRITEETTGNELLTEFGCVFGSALAQLEAQIGEDTSEAMFGTMYLLRHANAVFSEIHRRATFDDSPVAAPPPESQ